MTTKKWIWPQPDGKNWYVTTGNGKIIVKDENSNILKEKEGLSDIVVDLVEKNFFSVIAFQVSNFSDNSDVQEKTKDNNTVHVPFDPMFI